MPKPRLRPGNERDILAAKFEIENEEVFHIKNFYKRLSEWLADEGFASLEGDEKFEVLYLDRMRETGAQEHHIWWRAMRVPEGNSYFRYFLKIDFQTINMRKIEIMHKGQKFGTNKGNVIMRVEGWLQLDCNETWSESWLLNRFDKWFRKRLYHDKVLMYKRELYRTTYRMHTFIKQYLQLKTLVDWGKPFHPEKGV